MDVVLDLTNTTGIHEPLLSSGGIQEPLTPVEQYSIWDCLRYPVCLHVTSLLVVLFAIDVALQFGCTRRFLAPLAEDLPRLCAVFRVAWRRRGAALPHADAEIFVRFLDMGVMFSLLGSCVGGVLIWFYVSAGGDARGLHRLTLMNVPHKSPVIWGVIATAYVMEIIFIQLVLTEWRRVSAFRRDHNMKATCGVFGKEAAQARRTVIVENIPVGWRTEHKVRLYFESLFGEGSVLSCSLQRDSRSASAPRPAD